MVPRAPLRTYALRSPSGWRFRLGARAVTRSPTENRRSPLAMISSVPISPLTWRSRWARRLSWRRVVLRPVDHGVVEPVAVGVPPAAEDVAVHGQVVIDDVEVTGCLETLQRFVDSTVA